MPRSLLALVLLVAALAGVGWLGEWVRNGPAVCFNFAFNIRLLLTVVVISGLVRKSPLCWQAVLLVSGCEVFFGLFGFVLVVRDRVFSTDVLPLHDLLPLLGRVAGVVLLGVMLPWLVMRILLLPSVKTWFDLVCPFCRSPKIRPQGLLFQHALCKACGAGWRPGLARPAVHSSSVPSTPPSSP